MEFNQLAHDYMLSDTSDFYMPLDYFFYNKRKIMDEVIIIDNMELFTYNVFLLVSHGIVIISETIKFQ